MIKEIRVYPDPILSSPSHKIHRQSKDSLNRLAKDLKDTVKDHLGLGLAAPQIGTALKAFVVDIVPGQHVYEVYFNPEITWLSEEKEMDTEGCLSIPGLIAEVERPVEIKMKWDGGRGHFKGKLARIFQHEYDHLMGILLFERAGYLI